MQLQEDLLARDLGGDQALRRIRQLVLRKQPRPRRQAGGEMSLYIIDPVPVEARDHEERIEAAFPRQPIGETQQALAADQVDLVQRQDRMAAALCEAVENAPRVVVDAARSVDQQHGFVGILGARPGRRHHRPVEPPSRRENPGRVDKDDLRRAFDRDAEQPVARRLRLGRDDRQLVADEPVEQRRLAGIRRADQRDIAAAGRGGQRRFVH